LGDHQYIKISNKYYKQASKLTVAEGNKENKMGHGHGYKMKLSLKTLKMQWL
jgi:hypothetical protein